MAEPAPQLIQTERSQEQTTSRGYLWLTRGIAVLLLFAAGMKAWQLATVPSLGEGLLHARWFNIAVVEFEIAFACWLLMGLLPKLTRWATIALFTTFAGVSLYKAVSGEASCGCFGAVTVNPWWTMGLDVVVVVGLVVLSGLKLGNIITVSSFSVKTKFTSNWFVQTGLISLLLFIILTIQSVMFFGTFINIRSFLSSNDITFAIDRDNLPQENNSLFISVSNNTDENLTTIGALLDCSCGRLNGIPTVIPPGETTCIQFTASEGIDYSTKTVEYQKIMFYVGTKDTKRILVELPIFKFLSYQQKSGNV